MNFVDERHSLYVGWVLGIALSNGIKAVPVLDEAGNYTDRISIPLADGNDNLVTITVVVPPPPPDWWRDVLAVEVPARPGGRGYPLFESTPSDRSLWPKVVRKHGAPCERCGSTRSERVHTPEGPWLCWITSACDARVRAARKGTKSQA